MRNRLQPILSYQLEQRITARGYDDVGRCSGSKYTAYTKPKGLFNLSETEVKWEERGCFGSRRVAGFERRFNELGIDRKARMCSLSSAFTFTVIEWFQERFPQHSLVRCVAPYGDPCVNYSL